MFGKHMTGRSCGAMLAAGTFAGILMSLASLFSPAQASECSKGDAYLASVCWMAGSYCPLNYLMADGRLLSMSNSAYSGLYSVIGNRFGGDGRTSFALPDLRGTTAAGTGAGPGLAPVAVGQQYGAATVALTAANLPPHTHNWGLSGTALSGTIQAANVQGSSASPVGNYFTPRASTGAPTASSPLYGTTAQGIPMAAGAVTLKGDPATAVTQNTGSPQPNPVALRAPQLVMTPCIVVTGPFPVRP